MAGIAHRSGGEHRFAKRVILWKAFPDGGQGPVIQATAAFWINLPTQFGQVDPGKLLLQHPSTAIGGPSTQPAPSNAMAGDACSLQWLVGEPFHHQRGPKHRDPVVVSWIGGQNSGIAVCCASNNADSVAEAKACGHFGIYGSENISTGAHLR